MFYVISAFNFRRKNYVVLFSSWNGFIIMPKFRSELHDITEETRQREIFVALSRKNWEVS